MDDKAYTHRTASKQQRWRREAVELAAVFAAVAAADLVANVVVHGHDGPVLLLASAAAMLGAALFRGWLAHRHPPGRDALAPPGGPAVSSPEESDPPVLWRLRTTVADTPGSLARVCAALAERQVNIVSMQAHPLPDCTVDEFIVRAPAALPRAGLTAAVAAGGGRDIWTDRADAHELVDVPRQVLALATRTALDAAELPVALRQLFGRAAIRQYPGRGSAAQPGVDGHLMRLPLPNGDLLELSRPNLPFTPTEFARARALVELDTVLGPRVPQVEARISRPAGDDLTVRRATPADKAAAVAMHGRCSPESLRRRYHGPVKDADRYLDHLLDPRHGQTLAVETAQGRLVALSHLMWDDEGAEIALLVEDAWQRRGLGVDLVRRMAALALEAGVGTVYAVTTAANTGLISTMRRLSAPLDYQVEDGTLVITAHLAEAAEKLPAPWAAR
ncbi:GNAT family N-acetyltransferase [Kitasatospora cheerisanensis]|uniref:Acetyltransferase n=1 Tax=Kitasatospora cheerisanensis KCTC 2395 TaxID=1348663 RepID=A0A066Z0R8_9ACTN|nr:GNAT family N-acetyltransferase [Kitasatospora cheerisanensis]KDN87383.1 acetyltransferase [Kitasatospora cheerisanensis KCTC 2395]